MSPIEQKGLLTGQQPPHPTTRNPAEFQKASDDVRDFFPTYCYRRSGSPALQYLLEYIRGRFAPGKAGTACRDTTRPAPSDASSLFPFLGPQVVDRRPPHPACGATPSAISPCHRHSLGHSGSLQPVVRHTFACPYAARAKPYVAWLCAPLSRALLSLPLSFSLLSPASTADLPIAPPAMLRIVEP